MGADSKTIPERLRSSERQRAATELDFLLETARGEWAGQHFLASNI